MMFQPEYTSIYAQIQHPTRWVTEELLSREEIHGLMPKLIDDEHLFFQLGEEEGDAVFTRSFSLLWIPLLLHTHQTAPLFAMEELARLKRRVLCYVEGERDLRGYVPEKGWAHAAAHCADVLGWLALCQEFTQGDLIDLLYAIAHLATAATHVYTDDEDERLSVATLDLLRRNLLREADWTAWIQDLVTMGQTTEDTPQSRTRTINTKHFLRSLYFRLRTPADDEEEASIINAHLITTLAAAVPAVTRF